MIMSFSFAVKTTASVLTTLGLITGAGLAVDERYTTEDQLKQSQNIQNYSIVAQLQDFRGRYIDDRLKHLNDEHVRLIQKKQVLPDSFTATDEWRKQSIMDDIEQLKDEKKSLNIEKQKALEVFSKDNGE